MLHQARWVWIFAALWVLSACAPAANMRPIHPIMPGKYVELGAGYTVRTPRVAFPDDPWQHAGQAWGSVRPAPESAPWLELSLVGVFGENAANEFTGAVGVGVRFRIVDHDRVAFGVGIEIGTGWMALDLPIAVRFARDAWVYAAPQLETGFSLTRPLSFRTYAGLSLRLVDALMLRVETQHALPGLDPQQQSFNLGLGLAYQL